MKVKTSSWKAENNDCGNLPRDGTPTLVVIICRLSRSKAAFTLDSVPRGVVRYVASFSPQHIAMCRNTLQYTARSNGISPIVHLVNCAFNMRTYCNNCYKQSPVWARGRCRISPPRFLAECCKRQLNQVSFVLLYFRLSTFSDLY